jgi:hypothetical protein
VGLPNIKLVRETSLLSTTSNRPYHGGNGATDSRHVLVSDCIVSILSLIPVSVFPWLVRKSIVLDLGLQMKKNIFVFFFNAAKYLVYQIGFWWDQSSEKIQITCLTFQRQYMCIVSRK